MTDRAWTPESLADIVGVIDLMDGSAVHAVAGNRAEYLPVRCCDGSPSRLAAHYFSLGVNSLYLADLSSIQHRSPQWDVVQAIAKISEDRKIWLDLGWVGDESDQAVDQLVSLNQQHPNLQFIAASESCGSVHAVAQLARFVGADRTWFGLDYRNGQLLGSVPQEKHWIECAREVGIAGVVVLDLVAVGTGGGPSTEEICRRVRQSAPELRIVSGGGVRNFSDALRLKQAGCEKVLVATALQNGSNPFT